MFMMNYGSRFAASMLALLLCLFGPATTNAAEFNWHNGAIEILNDSDYSLDVQVSHAIGVLYGWTRVAPHQWFAANNCCYVAGQTYTIYVRVLDPKSLFPSPLGGETTLALCNKNGIPFGYASVEFSIHYEPNGPRISPLKSDYHPRFRRLDPQCP